MASLNVNRRDFIPTSGLRTASVQVTDPTDGATYYGKGELVITDDKGTVLTTATALKTVDAINIKMRGKEGKTTYNARIAGKDITGYTMSKYQAPVELVHVVDFGLTTTDVDGTYGIRMQDDKCSGYYQYFSDQLTISTPTAISKAALVGLFVTQFNARFKTNNKHHTTFYAEASLVDTDKLQITTLHFGFDPIEDKYSPERYSVQVTGAPLATVTSNKIAPIVTPAVAQMNPGVGSYYQVAQTEFEAAGFTNDKMANIMPTTIPANIQYQAEEFFVDGTTPNGYDLLTINYAIDGGNYTKTQQPGAVHLYLPIEGNDLSQVDVATVGIVPVLNKYIATEWGVGLAVTVS